MPTVHTFTEAGGHAHNEDLFLVQPSPHDPDCWLCVLADGVGGQPGGARAARLACEATMATAVKLPVAALETMEVWGELLEGVDADVAADPDAGFTTLIGFCVTSANVVGASCGDSAVLLVDHSIAPVVLTKHQFKNPPIGWGEATIVPFSMHLYGPWQVLAMSDGVWKYVGWERVCDLASTLRGNELLAALELAARLPGSGAFQDDFTAVVLTEDAD
jgi:hypothetical protein